MLSRRQESDTLGRGALSGMRPTRGVGPFSLSYGQETHLRFRGVYPTEGSCRFPLIIVDAANSIRVFGGWSLQI